MLYFIKTKFFRILALLIVNCLVFVQTYAQLPTPPNGGSLQYVLALLDQNNAVDAEVVEAYQDFFLVRVLISLDSDIASVAPNSFSQTSSDGKYLSSEASRINSIKTLQQAELNNATNKRNALYTRWASSGIVINSDMKLWESKYRPIMALTVNPMMLNLMAQDEDIAHVSLSSGYSVSLPETRPLIYKRQQPPVVYPVFKQFDIKKGCNTSASQKCTDKLGGNSVVAVIDTGVELNHPFFEGRVLGGICTSKAQEISEFARLFSVCSPQTAAGGACDSKECQHGTAVAGIISGRKTEYEGISPAANILPIQAASRGEVLRCVGVDGELDPFLARQPPESCPLVWVETQPHFTSEALIESLEFAYQKSTDGFPNIGDGSLRVTTVNMSIGSKPGSKPCDVSNVLYNSIQQLVVAGVAVVAASGNDSNKSAISSPACLPNVISVGAMYDGSADEDGNVYAKNTVVPESNSSPDLDFLAPAYYTTTSVLNGQYTDYFAGTSAAAPHIAGAIAVTKGRFPDLSLDYIVHSLKYPGSADKFITDSNDITTPVVKLGTTLYKLCEKHSQLSSTNNNRTDICESNIIVGPVQ